MPSGIEQHGSTLAKKSAAVKRRCSVCQQSIGPPHRWSLASRWSVSAPWLQWVGNGIVLITA